MNRKLVLMAVLVAMTVVSGCTGKWETGDTCKCPNLIKTAPTIDFIGDGQIPIRVIDGSAPGSRPLQVDLVYAAEYSDVVLVEIAERFIDAGFETDSKLELPLRDPVFFTEDQWEVVIGGTGSGGNIRIRVRIVEPDRDAAEALALLMDALGTVP
ncbi:MAG: hypothetical protein GWP18_04330 [Proteobacteria bacterium]|nr:hypothetical protein [Pseudomonadota bacterium]